MENQRLISTTTTWCKNQFFHVLLLRYTASFLWQDCYTALTQIGRKWSIQRQLGTMPLLPTAAQKDQNCSRFPSQRMENFFPLSHRTLPNAWISREHSERKHLSKTGSVRGTMHSRSFDRHAVDHGMCNIYGKKKSNNKKTIDVAVDLRKDKTTAITATTTTKRQCNTPCSHRRRITCCSSRFTH